jgi:hypothetical protein
MAQRLSRWIVDLPEDGSTVDMSFPGGVWCYVFDCYIVAEISFDGGDWLDMQSHMLFVACFDKVSVRRVPYASPGQVRLTLGDGEPMRTINADYTTD